MPTCSLCISFNDYTLTDIKYEAIEHKRYLCYNILTYDMQIEALKHDIPSGIRVPSLPIRPMVDPNILNGRNRGVVYTQADMKELLDAINQQIRSRSINTNRTEIDVIRIYREAA